MDKNSLIERFWGVVFLACIGIPIWYFFIKSVPLNIECHSYDGRFNIAVSLDNTKWINPKIPIKGYFGIIDNQERTYLTNEIPIKEKLYYDADKPFYTNSVTIKFNTNILYLADNHQSALYQPSSSASTRYPLICYEYYKASIIDNLVLQVKQNLVKKLGSSNE
jgi:hypothetical protein